MLVGNLEKMLQAMLHSLFEEQPVTMESVEALRLMVHPMSGLPGKVLFTVLSGQMATWNLKYLIGAQFPQLPVIL